MSDLKINPGQSESQKISTDKFSELSGAPKASDIGEGNYAIANIFATVGFVVTDEGIVVIDAGVDEKTAESALRVIREISDKPIKYLIYTHGHGDHVKGAAVFKREGASIIAHKNVSRRFDRYINFSGYHARINGIQFASTSFVDAKYWESFVYPDVEYTDECSFELGGKKIVLRHEKGETDDATVVTVLPDNIVYAGDLLIWGFPNIGNPNKVIRYEHEWYEALDRIMAQNPKAAIPGHGPVLFGDDVQKALSDTGEALKLLYEQAKKFINEGRDLDYIIAHTSLPDHLKNSPYIRETYGTREFVLRGIHRRYTGWYDGNPSNLNPAPKADVAKAIFELIDKPKKILAKAEKLAKAGDVRLALHIVDIALSGGNEDKDAFKLKSELLKKLGLSSDNLFYRNFYLHESEKLTEEFTQ